LAAASTAIPHLLNFPFECARLLGGTHTARHHSNELSRFLDNRGLKVSLTQTALIQIKVSDNIATNRV
jgi:hypothetical protein